MNLVWALSTRSEFFPDETFVDGKVMDMSMKMIKKGVNPHADRLLEWVTRGCADALRNKYLETVSLGIFTDVDKPETVVETYTLSFSYPSSSDHEMVRKIRQGAPSVTLKTADGKETTISPPENESFGKQLVKILRTLCVMIQTLKCLPLKKYASMQMTYYDELTPTSYEPPGFEPGVFSVHYLFASKTFKHDFGFIASSFHRIGLQLETAAENAIPEDNDAVGIVPKQEVPHDELAPSLTILSQQPKRDNQDTAVPGRCTKGAKKLNEKINCLCGDSDTDLDMILCEECKTWQHTPCAGYCTNKDKRIPEKYACYNCTFKGKGKLLRNLQELASFRRAISVVYSEGLESIKWLSRRLECGVAKASKLIRRLESEGLVSRPESQVRTYAYTVHKTPEAKERIRYFFSQDLSVFPELMSYFKDKSGVEVCKSKKAAATNEEAARPPKRRKSVTIGKVSCS